MDRSLPKLVDARLAAAMSHPTRIRAMKVLFERAASPSEVAVELGEPANNVAYHIKQLVDLGCVELVDSRPAQGGRVIEHFYRATRRALFEAEDWERLSDREKTDVVMSVMRVVSEEVAEAMTQGTFYDPDDGHLSRSPMVVDREGWDEVTALLDRTCEELIAIQERIVNRAGNEQTGKMQIRVAIMQFRSPSPKER